MHFIIYRLFKSILQNIFSKYLKIYRYEAVKTKIFNDYLKHNYILNNFINIYVYNNSLISSKFFCKLIYLFLMFHSIVFSYTHDTTIYEKDHLLHSYNGDFDYNLINEYNRLGRNTKNNYHLNNFVYDHHRYQKHRIFRRLSSQECGPQQFAIPIEHWKINDTKIKNNFYIYGITEDCQVFYARADQLSQISSTVKVDRRFTHCKPELVQLHWRQIKESVKMDKCGKLTSDKDLKNKCLLNNKQLHLELLLKESERQICRLPLEFPMEDLLRVGTTPFSYPLRAALNYAVCSIVSNSTFHLDPALSFSDALYANVLYFIEPTSNGAFWTTRQFKIDELGYLHLLDMFDIRAFENNTSTNNDDSENIYASHFIAATDAQKHSLYLIERRGNHSQYSLYRTDAYNLLFRPHLSKVEKEKLHVFEHKSTKNYISYTVNSLAFEKNVIMFSETLHTKKGSSDSFSTRLYFAKRKWNALKSKRKNMAQCALEVPFRTKFGIISTEGLQKLLTTHISDFGDRQANKSIKKNDDSSITGDENQPMNENEGSGSDIFDQHRQHKNNIIVNNSTAEERLIQKMQTRNEKSEKTKSINENRKRNDAHVPIINKTHTFSIFLVIYINYFRNTALFLF